MGIVSAYAVPHPPLIIPAVGRGMEERVEATQTAYREVARRIVTERPDVLVVLSSHAPAFRDAFYVSQGSAAVASMKDFDAPKERFSVQYHEALAAAICERARDAGVPVTGYEPYGSDVDHATFIPLWFVRQALQEAREGQNSQQVLPPIVRIGLSGLPAGDHLLMGRAVRHACEDAGLRVVVIASGDLSHRLLPEEPYGFQPEGPRFDAMVTELFANGRLEGLFDIDDDFADAAGECGLRPFRIMAGALEGAEVEPELLSYEGPYGVGYAVAAFRCIGQRVDSDGDSAAAPGDAPADLASDAPAESADPYVALARASVEHYVKTGKPLPRDAWPADLPQELTERRAGAFVSLHAYGDLRGCIGTISACAPTLADEIVNNGISAATCDPRFPAVRPEELDYISYSVDVLGAPSLIASTDDLDPARYGVIVTKDFRRGLLLPNLPGVDTVEQQVSIARRKAGIGEWEDGVKLQRFRVVRHERGGEARCEW